jgi:hypothetical protein
MGILDKAKKLFGGAGEKTGDLAKKAGEAAHEAYEKVEDVAEGAADRIRGEERPSEEKTPGEPPA